MPTPIDTRTVAARRKLQFADLDAALREAESLAAADAAGTLRSLGNWTLGQALAHLAAWINYSYDGYPMSPPWLLRALGPLLKSMVLKGNMRPGMRMKGAPGGTYGADLVSTAEGLARFARAAARLQAACPSRPNPVFGRLTHDEWRRLHAHHAALHLGFFRVDA